MDSVTPSLAGEFDRDGYVIVPSVLGPQLCAELQFELVAAFSAGHSTVIRNPESRIHAPLALSEPVTDALSLTMECLGPVLEVFLQNQKELVELSSITVFPGAKEQQLHRDEANEGHFLASVFINLAATREEAGALHVIPGSHTLSEGGQGEATALEVPAGSMVLMNSKLLHCGGSNLSADRVRAVLYFTFGEEKLYGPPYSILSEVAAQHLTISELSPGPGQRRIGWNAQSRPHLSPECQILLPLSSEHEGEELLLCQRGTIRRQLLLGDPAPELLVELLQTIECHPQQLELADLATQHSIDLDHLLAHCERLGRDGWIRH